MYAKHCINNKCNNHSKIQAYLQYYCVQVAHVLSVFGLSVNMPALFKECRCGKSTQK